MIYEQLAFKFCHQNFRFSLAACCSNADAPILSASVTVKTTLNLESSCKFHSKYHSYLPPRQICALQARWRRLYKHQRNLGMIIMNCNSRRNVTSDACGGILTCSAIKFRKFFITIQHTFEVASHNIHHLIFKETKITFLSHQTQKVLWVWECVIFPPLAFLLWCFSSLNSQAHTRWKANI